MGFVSTRNKGFTLIELVLVLAVLGVMLSLAAAVLPDQNATRLANEAARLVKVLDTLQLEAMLQRTQAGLLLEADGYRTAVLNMSTLEWQNSELKILAQHQLQASGLQLEILHEPADAAGVEGVPVIVFDAAGVSEPFELRLANSTIDGLVTTLTSDGLHRVKLQ
jgi:type II secretion system protein H